MDDLIYLTCPLTHLLMHDPVLASDGMTYEREAIENWFQENSKSPITLEEMCNKDLRTNFALKKIINSHLSKNMHLIEENKLYFCVKLITELRDDIIHNRIDSIKYKLANYIDYRYFLKSLCLEMTKKGYSAFYLAAEDGSRELTKEFFDYLFKKNLLQKMDPKPTNWHPVYLKDILIELFTDDFNDEKEFKLVELLKIDPECLNSADNKSKQTSLFVACDFNNYKAVKFLLENGALVNQIDKKGENCMHIAVKNHNKDIIELLVKNGANTDWENHSCKTPVDIASKEIRKFILSKRNNVFDEFHQANLSLKRKLDFIEKENLKLVDNIRLIKTIHKLGNSSDLNSPKYVASGNSDGSIKIWDITTSLCIKTLIEHKDEVLRVELLPNGSLASCSKDKTIKIWDLVKGECVKTFEGHEESVCALIVGSDGTLISGSNDYTIKVWDVEKSECLRTLNGHAYTVSDFQMNPNGNLISSSYDKTIKIWNLSTGECLKTLVGHQDCIEVIKLKDENNLLSAGNDMKINVWNLKTGDCIKTLSLEFNVNQTPIAFYFTDFAFLNSTQIACCYNHKKGKIDVLDFETGLLVKSLEGHSNFVNQIKVLPNRTFLSCSSDGMIKNWCLEAEKCLLGQFDRHTSGIMCLKLIFKQNLFA